jgi:hypothetical protein
VCCARVVQSVSLSDVALASSRCAAAQRSQMSGLNLPIASGPGRAILRKNPPEDNARRIARRHARRIARRAARGAWQGARGRAGRLALHCACPLRASAARMPPARWRPAAVEHVWMERAPRLGKPAAARRRPAGRRHTAPSRCPSAPRCAPYSAYQRVPLARTDARVVPSALLSGTRCGGARRRRYGVRTAP